MKIFPLSSPLGMALPALATLAPLASAQTTLLAKEFVEPVHRGTAAVPIGDVDGDGLVDLLMWSPGEPRGLAGFGPPPVVKVLSGLTLEPIHSIAVPSSWRGQMGATPIADRTGDGVRDIAVFTADHHGLPSEVRFYDSDGTYLSSVLGNLIQTTFAWDVVDLGDVDGDGVGDLAVSDPDAAVGPQTYGRIHVLSGATDLPIRTIDQPFTGLSGLGRHLYAVGDVDGDGVTDLAASTSTEFLGAATDGFIVVSGSTGAWLWSASGSETFGSSVAVLDDHDADGVADLAVTTGSTCDGGAFTENVTLLSGATGDVIRVIASPAAVGDCDVQSVTSIDDIDGDGLRDLALATYHLQGGPGTYGRVHLLSSVTGNTLAVEVGADGASYGFSVMSSGDRNLDGVTDLIVGGSTPVSATGAYRASVSILSPVDSVPIELYGLDFQYPNSTGFVTSLSAYGSPSVQENELTLVAQRMPAASYGFFIASVNEGQNWGQQGYLLLNGPIGRFVGPGQVLQAGATGSFQVGVDLSQFPTPTGFVPVLAGETWHFQAWHRDSSGGFPTSRFSDRQSIEFLP